MIRIKRKNPPTYSQIRGFEIGSRIIKGKRRAISTSKIKKITAIRKNRREKGSREDLLGSKPHSKGDLFSRSTIEFLDSKDANNITIDVIKIKTTPKESMTKITYFENIQTF